MTYFHHLCAVGRMMPVNQMIYNGKDFSGDYTYIKDDKKFQIDFLLTSANGREYIEDFQIIENN